MKPVFNQLEDGRTKKHETNAKAHTFTISQKSILANFEIPTQGRANHIRLMSREQIKVVSSHPDEATQINRLFQPHEGPTRDKRCYRTPETCEGLVHLNPIERQTDGAKLKLRKLKKLDPAADDKQQKAFLEQFSWKNSTNTRTTG